MALDRQSIEKKDFPIGPGGYDPEAVAAHLARLADEVERLKRSSQGRTETIASAASEQVRAIVEAAESSAGELRRQAERESQEIRAKAAADAESTRQQVSTEAREYLGKVSESTAGMLQRLDAIESELGGLTESLRTGASRINADLQLLELGMQELRGSAAAAAPAAAPQPSSPAEPALEEPVVEVGAADSDVAEAVGATETAIPTEAAFATDEPFAADAAIATGGDSVAPRQRDDTEGARLIALNMALNGTPREETLRYLAENFSLADADRLLRDVYASVEG